MEGRTEDRRRRKLGEAVSTRAEDDRRGVDSRGGSGMGVMICDVLRR